MTAGSLEDICRPVADDLSRVRAAMALCVRRQPKEIRESLARCFTPGGKLLRPLLSLLCARAAAARELGPVPARETVLFAAAVEFVHNASLVHDDIMDGDLVRRNAATLQARFGPSSAVLLGDVLHITVFDILGRIDSRPAIVLMTRAIREMCYGQLLDVNRESRLRSSEYERIIRRKTGALMAAACAGGAVMSGAALSSRSVREIGRFGMQLGMLYQMADDRIDGDAGIPLPAAAIRKAADSARSRLSVFSPSSYRAKLYDIIDYVASMAVSKEETICP